MRRIAITVTVLALVAGAFGCSSDAPTPPKTGGPGPTGSTALQIRLFTSNPNPTAGSCTLIQAIVTLNGANVADGTGVVFSTDFGVFGQNGLPLISVVTQNGSAVTALCSSFAGTAVVRATSTVGSETAAATITIAFQPSATAGPFVSFCSPSFGPNTGGTVLTINGGRFFGSASTTRVEFTAGGITREALVTSLTASTITVQTPGFPELTAPSVPVDIRVTLGTNTGTPVTLSLPNCFAFGTQTTNATPVVTAVLPASGVNEGNTRVTIIGSGFDTVGGVQVFFGDVEATIVSVSFNQIVVLTPAAFGSGSANLNETGDVRVRNIVSGLEGTLTDGYRYTQPLQLTAISNNEQRVDQPFTPVTIFGHGFQSPVVVTLADRPAVVISVSESELVVVPSRPLLAGCSDISGEVTVTNVNTGDTATGLSFTYLRLVTQPTITVIQPTQGQAGTVVTLTGTNLPLQPQDAEVKFGGRIAAVSTSTATELTVVAPSQPALTNPLCAVGVPVGTLTPTGGPVSVSVKNLLTGCEASAPDPFQYLFPCVVATPTPVLTATTTPTPTTTPIPPADLALTKVDSPDPVSSGADVTYTITLTNNGPGTATNATVADPLPAGTTYVSCSASLGSCSGPAVGTNGTVTLNPMSMGPLSSVTLTIVANVNAGPGTVISNTATASSSTPDSNLANNSDTEATTVGP